MIAKFPSVSIGNAGEKVSESEVARFGKGSCNNIDLNDRFNNFSRISFV